jgi:hypothetical protein
VILDRTTYEAWLLDRIEGNLTPEQERQLDAFLAANPDLPVDLGAFPSLPADELRIDWKSELHKHFPPTGEPDAARLNDFLVARYEGDLDAAQEKALARFLYEHPERAQDARRMAQAHVRADAEPYPERTALRRHFPPQGLPDRHRLVDFLIAAEENALDSAQRSALNALLRDDPDARREQRLVQAARVDASAITFPHKALLRKGGGRVVVLWQRLAMAASVALVLGAALWFLGKDKGAPENVAQRTVEPAAKSPITAGGADRSVPQAPAVGEPSVQRAATTDQVPDAQPGSPASDGRVRQVAPGPDAVQQNAPRQDTQIGPAPEPLHAPLPEPEQHIAQLPTPVNAPEGPDAVPANATAAGPAERRGTAPTPDIDASSLPTLLASTVRRAVGNDPQQEGTLDGGDALAALDRGLSAVTSGNGGLEVQRGGGRDRWKLRLGRSLAISASTGR